MKVNRKNLEEREASAWLIDALNDIQGKADGFAKRCGVSREKCELVLSQLAEWADEYWAKSEFGMRGGE